MKLISLDNLRIFKYNLNFGTLESDYYIEGIHEPDKSKCKIAFPARRSSRSYYYNPNYNPNGYFFTSDIILISEFKEFLNLFASFSKNGYIYAHSGDFTYNYNNYIMSSNSKIRIESNGNLFFECFPENLSLNPYEYIERVSFYLSAPGESAEK